MTWGYVAVAGATLVGGYMASDSAKDAAEGAAAANTASSQAGIEEQRRQFDAIQKLLQPYVTAGNSALTAQQDLIGLNGNDKQTAAIAALQGSPQFTSALKLGESSILANASATGGLRGGNTQAALAQFSPALLSSLISDRYGQLGNLASLGQNAAAGVGNAGLTTGSNVTNLLGQIGAGNAGAALASGKADTALISGVTNTLGQLIASGKFNNLFGGGSTTGGAGTIAGGGGMTYSGGF